MTKAKARLIAFMARLQKHGTPFCLGAVHLIGETVGMLEGQQLADALSDLPCEMCCTIFESYGVAWENAEVTGSFCYYEEPPEGLGGCPILAAREVHDNDPDVTVEIRDTGLLHVYSEELDAALEAAVDALKEEVGDDDEEDDFFFCG
jgi:hypothetical protein